MLLGPSKPSLGSPLVKQMSPPKPAQWSPPVKMRNVWSGPAPRRVTLLLLSKTIPALRLYVPAFRNTTCPDGHAEIASVICVAVAPGLSVAQIVVRIGMPPRTPACVQSVLREGSMIPAIAVAGRSAARKPKRPASHLTDSSLLSVPVRRCPRATEYPGYDVPFVPIPAPAYVREIRVSCPFRPRDEKGRRATNRLRGGLVASDPYLHGCQIYFRCNYRAVHREAKKLLEVVSLHWGSVHSSGEL